MVKTKDGYRLSTGREFSADAVLGINPDNPVLLYYGHDGQAIESYPREPWMDEADANPPFTLEERREIARFAIAAWREFVKQGA